MYYWRFAGLWPLAMLCLFLGSPGFAGTPTPARPLGSPGEWITSRDYPLSALRDRIQGITYFRVTIGKGGQVTECSIVNSSGSKLLDDTACSLVSQRARFAPATNAHGRPAEGAYSNRVRWALPDGLPTHPIRYPVLVRVKPLLTVDPAGNVVTVK